MIYILLISRASYFILLVLHVTNIKTDRFYVEFIYFISLSFVGLIFKNYNRKIFFERKLSLS